MQDSFPVFVSVALEPSPTEGAFSSIGALWMRRSDTGPELRPSSCVWFSHQLGRGRGATAAHDDVTPALARSRAGPGRAGLLIGSRDSHTSFCWACGDRSSFIERAAQSRAGHRAGSEPGPASQRGLVQISWQHD
jgi:hypothetical protein